MVTAEKELISLEERFWRESNNPEFFNQIFADDGVTVIEPMGIIEKPQAVEMSKESPGWENVEMEGVRTLQITPDCVGVIYHGHAKKKGSTETYHAAMISVYAKRDGEWQLVLSSHQPLKDEEKK
jgi:hypothetical protein